MDWLNLDSWSGVLNAWNLTRSAGIVCYLLLSLSVITGLYSSIKKKQGQQQSVLPHLHLTLGNWGLYTGLFHAGILLFDQYVKLGATDIVVPFMTSYQTVPMGIGIIALYLLIGTILTTELRAKIGLKVWRKLHMLSPIAYVLSTVHGIWMGSDAGELSSIVMYIGSITAVLIMVLVRIRTASGKRVEVASEA